MRRRKKRYIALLIGAAIIFNQPMVSYSYNKGAESIDLSSANQLREVVYLTGGQGATSIGDGTLNNPYQNIKTALNNVKQGGTIIITGIFKYWEYEETSSLLNKPVIIDKEVTIEGETGNNQFIIRAPIQLGADVTFKNLNMQFWASNELMPGVPDSGIPQTPVDEGTNFRSSRSIYLAGYKLTLDNVDTGIKTAAYQRSYRPYISGGTFIEGGNTGSKAVLEVKNPNSETQFAGIYAGDYWKERNYPVELNVKGKVIDKTIHSGGIMAYSNSEVVINLGYKTGVAIIDTEKQKATTDVNIKDEAVLTNANLGNIRNLTLENGSTITMAENSKFEIDNLNIYDGSLLDLRGVVDNANVKGTFRGEVDDSSAGSIFLDDDTSLQIGGDVEGTTILNTFRFNIIPLKENNTYIRARANASGNFIIKPKYEQLKYELVKNIDDNSYTTWTTIRNTEIFKDLRWANEEKVIINPSETEEYSIYYELINDKDEAYLPFGEEWNDINVTLTRENGTILDLDNYSDGDIDIDTYIEDEDKIYVLLSFSEQFINKNTSEELILEVSYKGEKSISKKIIISNEKNDNTIIDVNNIAKRYNLARGQEGYEEIYDLNKDDIIDIFDIVLAAKSMNN